MKRFALCLMFALALAGVSKAQYSNPNDSALNEQYAPTGIPTMRNTDGGPLAVQVNFILHYSAPDATADKYESLRKLSIDYFNEQMVARYPSALVRFRQVGKDEQPNLILNFDVYHFNDDTYAVYLECRGLGVGHLFRYNRPGAKVEDAWATVWTELPIYIATGWHHNPSGN